MANLGASTSNQFEPTLEVGQLIDGKYRVDFCLGQGGMAAVWAGTNERTGKQIALKVLLPAIAGVAGVDDLFQAEVIAASRVNHPNVVTVFDVIEHNHMACIVMELLDGEPLERLLARSGPLSVHDACGLLLPAMRGVAAAHAQGVVHRDLKPANIFVCVGPQGRVETTKVLDFGISMLVGRAREQVTTLSQSWFMGTPTYMAPEQIAPDGIIDERADVYGFGVLFYEALTGEVPFPGEPGLPLYDRILSAPVPPLTQFRSDIPLGLARIIETALAKSPAARYPDLLTMIAAIEAELQEAVPAHRSLTPSAGTVFQLVAVDGSSRIVISDEGNARNASAGGRPAATKVMVNFPRGSEGVAAPVQEAEVEQASLAHDPLVHGRSARRKVSVLTKLLMFYQRMGWLWAGVGIGLVIVGAMFVLSQGKSNAHRVQERSSLPVVRPGTTEGKRVTVEGKTRAAQSVAGRSMPVIEKLPASSRPVQSTSPAAGDEHELISPAAGIREQELGPYDGARRRSLSRSARRADRRSLLAPEQTKGRKAGMKARAGALSADDF